MVMESATTCVVRKDRASLCSFVGTVVPHEQRTSTRSSHHSRTWQSRYTPPYARCAWMASAVPYSIASSREQ
jgi:hypothetical protein